MLWNRLLLLCLLLQIVVVIVTVRGMVVFLGGFERWRVVQVMDEKSEVAETW